MAGRNRLRNSRANGQLREPGYPASRSAFAWSSTQKRVAGIASSRASPIGRPHAWHVPYSPRSRRWKAASTSVSSYSTCSSRETFFSSSKVSVPLSPGCWSKLDSSPPVSEVASSCSRWRSSRIPWSRVRSSSSRLRALALSMGSSGRSTSSSGSRRRYQPPRSGAVQAAVDGVAHQLIAPGQLELGEDVLDVVLDRLDAEEQLVGDLLVGVALGHQAQDLGLAGGQAGLGAAAHAPELAQDQGGQGRREGRLP